jgi:adenylate kinase
MQIEVGKISRRRFLQRSAAAFAVASKLAVASANPLQGSEAESSWRGVIVLLGPPGAGKSEQSRRMADRYSIPIVSTGGLLRDNVRRGTPLGLQAEPYMKAGKLVPEPLMDTILEDRLAQPDCERGFILDGYPRSLVQAEKLGPLLERRGLKPQVLLIDVSTEEIMKRLAGRRVCPKCNRTYNIYFKPPKVENHCDADGTLLVQRADDKEDVIRERLETYHQQTQPVIEYYKSKGLLTSVNGDLTPEQVAAEIEAKLAAQAMP